MSIDQIVLQCPVCKNGYKKPKILPACGHSFCLDCILSVAGKTQSIICPQCQTTSVIGNRGPEGLTSNLSLELVAEHSNIKRVDSELCLHQQSRKTSSTCSHCGQKFCFRCQFYHDEKMKLEIISRFREVRTRIESVKKDNTDQQREDIAKIVNKAKERILSVTDEIMEKVNRAIQDLRSNMLKFAEEIGSAKSEELEAAITESKIHVDISIKNKLESLPSISVLHMSRDELLILLDEVKKYDDKLRNFEDLLTSSKSAEIVVGKNDDLTKYLLNCFDNVKIDMKWTEVAKAASNDLISTVKDLHQAIEDDNFEKVVEISENHQWTPGQLRDLLESQHVNEMTALVHAVMGGKVNIARYLIKTCGANVKATFGRRQSSIISLAVVGRHIDIVKDLIARDPSVCKCRDNETGTPLHQAACIGDKEMCLLFLEQKETDIEAQVTNLRTPLLEAASAGHLPVVRLLIAKGARAAAKDDQGRTALHLASYFDHPQVVKYLLENSPGLRHEIDNYKQTPFVMAMAFEKHQVIKVFKHFEKYRK